MRNAPACIAEIAREERWDQINIEIKPFHTLYDGSLAGYSVIAGNPKHKRRYEVNKTLGYEKSVIKTPEGEKIVIEDPPYLRNLSRMQVLYFLRDNMIPEAQERNVKTNLDLRVIKSQIQTIEEYLQKEIENKKTDLTKKKYSDRLRSKLPESESIRKFIGGLMFPVSVILSPAIALGWLAYQGGRIGYEKIKSHYSKK